MGAVMVPDFYQRLGVAPSAERAEIEAALQRMQPVWSMGTRNPKSRHVNQMYLDEIPALRRALLSDPTSRAAYDAELSLLQTEARDRKLDALQRLVRIRAAKGGLNRLDREMLAKESAQLGLGEEDLAKLIHGIPDLTEHASNNGDAEDDFDPPVDTLDPSTRRQIRVALEHLGRRDLYEAIGVARDAPSSHIAARADEERQRWMKKAQVTAEKTAWLEIITHAQSHLTNPKARSRYNHTLKVEAEESFITLAEFALNGLSRLDAATAATLVDEAAAEGIPSSRAERLIARICRKLSVARDQSASPIPVATGQAAYPVGLPPGGVPAIANGKHRSSVLRCRKCAGITELSVVAKKSGNARCRHCGTSLRWQCPVCRREAWVDEKRCACGFRRALVEPLNRHFEAAQQAFRAFELDRALEHLERVKTMAPGHAGARQGIARVRQRQAAIVRVKHAFETARAAAKLCAARTALEAWSRGVDPNSPELRAAWDEIAADIGRAESLAARARNLERTDPSAARELYRRSLAIAADLPDALAGLHRTPPDPPTTLDAQVMGDRIRLHWTPPAPDGLGLLTYVIVRKRGGALVHPGDGTRIAEVSTTDFDDTHVAPGDTVGYAVLSKRSGVESVAAISLGPFLYLADVKDVRVDLREREIELAWQAPRGAAEVRVIRKHDGPPRDYRDGERLATALDHAVDRKVAPDAIYHYGVYAIYRSADGRLFPSPGVVVSAQPSPVVSALDAPRLVREPGGGVRLNWVEPVRGVVKILRSASPLFHPPGTRLAADEAKAIDALWIEPIAPDHAVDREPPTEGRCFYTPLTAWSDVFIVGHGVALGRVADPTDLRATRAGGGANGQPGGTRVMLRWQWAPQAGASVIVARRGAAGARPGDPDAISELVHFDEYERLGSWTITLPEPELGEPNTHPSAPAAPGGAGPWHIRVYSVIDEEGARSFSPGSEPTAATVLPGPNPEVSVSYELKRPWLIGLPWTVAFRVKPPHTPLPPLVLVAHPRAAPLSADDGEIVARFPAAQPGRRHAIRTKIDLAKYSVRAFADPQAEPQLISPFQLVHPDGGHDRV